MVLSENNGHLVGLKLREHWEELEKMKREAEAEPYPMLGPGSFVLFFPFF